MSFRGVGNLQEPSYCYSWIEKTQKVQYNKGSIQGFLDNTFTVIKLLISCNYLIWFYTTKFQVADHFKLILN